MRKLLVFLAFLGFLNASDLSGRFTDTELADITFASIECFKKHESVKAQASKAFDAILQMQTQGETLEVYALVLGEAVLLKKQLLENCKAYNNNALIRAFLKVDGSLSLTSELLGRVASHSLFVGDGKL